MVVATINVGANPIGVAFDGANNDVYVANAASNTPGALPTISVIDSSSNTVVATISDSSFKAPWGVAYDRANREIYVTNFVGNTVSVISS